MSGGSRKKRGVKEEDDDVEKLLRATEDDILLKLSVDSHMSRGSSSQILDPDLDLRLQALRSKSKPTKPSKSPAVTSTSTTDRPDVKPNQVGVDGDDDLFARFAALKSSLPSYSPNNQRLSKMENTDTEEDDAEDEVDKVISWAMDSARLDPSPSSDEDRDTDNEDDDTDSSDDDEDDTVKGKKKGKRN